MGSRAITNGSNLFGILNLHAVTFLRPGITLMISGCRANCMHIAFIVWQFCPGTTMGEHLPFDLCDRCVDFLSVEWLASMDLECEAGYFCLLLHLIGKILASITARCDNAFVPVGLQLVRGSPHRDRDDDVVLFVTHRLRSCDQKQAKIRIATAATHCHLRIVVH